jgi:uncharacterized membrane protein
MKIKDGYEQVMIQRKSFLKLQFVNGFLKGTRIFFADARL